MEKQGLIAAGFAETLQTEGILMAGWEREKAGVEGRHEDSCPSISVTRSETGRRGRLYIPQWRPDSKCTISTCFDLADGVVSPSNARLITAQYNK